MPHRPDRVPRPLGRLIHHALRGGGVVPGNCFEVGCIVPEALPRPRIQPVNPAVDLGHRLAGPRQARLDNELRGGRVFLPDAVSFDADLGVEGGTPPAHESAVALSPGYERKDLRPFFVGDSRVGFDRSDE
jgi:hypothetical protein